jgi:hypothetical protein
MVSADQAAAQVGEVMQLDVKGVAIASTVAGSIRAARQSEGLDRTGSEAFTRCAGQSPAHYARADH